MERVKNANYEKGPMMSASCHEAVVQACVAGKATYKNENGELVTFAPVKQEDGTYLMVGSKAEKGEVGNEKKKTAITVENGKLSLVVANECERTTMAVTNDAITLCINQELSTNRQD